MKLNTSVQMRKFYAAANSILHNTTHVSEVVRLSLVESCALPMLTYACETHNLCSSKMRNLSVCWNSIFGKKFSSYHNKSW